MTILVPERGSGIALHPSSTDGRTPALRFGPGLRLCVRNPTMSDVSGPGLVRVGHLAHREGMGSSDSIPPRALRDADWMGLRGLNMRNPRRVAVEGGENACLDCLRWRGSDAGHERHAPHPPPDSMPRVWLVKEATQWDVIPGGTTLRLVAFRDWHFDDWHGLNSSWQYEFQFVASGGPVAGQVYIVSTSLPDDGSGGESPYPTFLVSVCAEVPPPER